jgi:hypothetical protein
MILGTDHTGTQDPGNANEGVIVFGNSSNNTIGGQERAARNLISDNSFRGLQIFGNGGNCAFLVLLGSCIVYLRNLNTTRSGGTPDKNAPAQGSEVFSG